MCVCVCVCVCVCGGVSVCASVCGCVSMCVPVVSWYAIIAVDLGVIMLLTTYAFQRRHSAKTTCTVYSSNWLHGHA